jgi:hypothetical protein
MSIDRFAVLLKSAAKQSFVTDEDLRNLVGNSLLKFISGKLKKRLIKIKEENRVYEFVDAFDLNEVALDVILAKNDIIRTLNRHELPNRVQLKEKIPILSQEEVVLWIFNQIVTTTRLADTFPEQGTQPRSRSGYVGRRSVGHKIDLKSDDVELDGDLVVTNRSLHFLSNSVAPIWIPIENISSVKRYSDGVALVESVGQKRIRLIALDDTWFATNLLESVMKFAAVGSAF